MDTHLLLQELERVNGLPLSKSVRNLIQEEDEGILYLEQFLIVKNAGNHAGRGDQVLGICFPASA